MEHGKRIIGRTGRPTTRLGEAEVLEIARKALERDMPLFVKDVQLGSESVEWIISTATVGSGYMVRINDASAAVLEVAPWGVR